MQHNKGDNCDNERKRYLIHYQVLFFKVYEFIFFLKRMGGTRTSSVNGKYRSDTGLSYSCSGHGNPAWCLCSIELK